MGQVIPFSFAQRQFPTSNLPALIESFSSFRKEQLDVLWLKENAELLSVLESTNSKVDVAAFETLLPFYEGSLRHLNFFRQYYRFILSICLDLEDLGLPGQRAEVMADWIAGQNIVATEMSDLQRAEACRLLARRGVYPAGTEGLTDRLRGFMRRSETFAVPNRKAAYELTHVVFYLTEYGRVPLSLDPEERLSLIFAGLVAYLDQDADLLSEICIALRFCAEEVPQDWARWLDRETVRFSLRPTQGRVGQDDYHTYLMCNWFQLLVGRSGFSGASFQGSVVIEGARRPGALRGMSMALYSLLDQTAGRWSQVQMPLYQALSAPDAAILHQAETSTPHFEAFFETFARFGQVGRAGAA